MSFFTGIVDVHAHDGRYDLETARAGGVEALLHKATEGRDFRDRGYAEAMARAADAGLLRGAYHFGSASAPGDAQADFFLATARAAGDDVLLALDLEENPGRAGTMTTREAARFVERVAAVTGRRPLLYGGSSDLRRRCRRAPADILTALGRCPLWLAQYDGEPAPADIPAAWTAWSLWQYTNGGTGPRDKAAFPRRVPGFARAAQDRSCFRGTADELRAWWAVAGGDAR